jgi:uncharacterized protein (DUF1015 family)
MTTMIAPFAGLRYNPRMIPDLGEVMTPPYDVIDEAERVTYMARSPYSMIHLILGAESEADTATDNRFTRAAACLQAWRQDGVLIPEPAPALYLYQQEFELDGETVTRTGFIARVRLAEYQEGMIFPHEQTFAGPKVDLLRLWGACRANLSPIFAVYADPARTLEAVFAPWLHQPPQCLVPHWMEGQHRLWVLRDPRVIARVQKALRDRPLVIADGHHRYETALALRDAMRRQHPAWDATTPSEYVMLYCANIHDPGLVALATHRLVRRLPVAHLGEMLRRLKWLQISTHQRRAGEELGQWQRRLEGELRRRQSQGCCLALYAGGESCYIVTASASIAARQVQAEGVSEAWKQLDVSILHHALLPALQAAYSVDEPLITYARRGDAVLQTVADGRNDLAVLMNPTPLEAMSAVAMQGERLPQKSTYFYPKLPTGLVINSFDV